jgi:hypothetical protein
MMAFAVLNFMAMPSCLPEPIGITMSPGIIMMMMRPSASDVNPCTDLNFNDRRSIVMRDTEKHASNAQNQPDLFFYHCTSVNLLKRIQWFCWHLLPDSKPKFFF